jgi:hypothetical protein
MAQRRVFVSHSSQDKAFAEALGGWRADAQHAHAAPPVPVSGPACSPAAAPPASPFK